MRGFAASIMLSLLALAGCATQRTAHAESGPASITIARGPCFGACPIYSARIDAPGSGHFNGTRFVAITGEREFASTPETFEQIRTLLAPWSPNSGEQYIGSGNCTRYATDHPTWSISWTERNGAVRTLHFDTGCHDDRYKPLAEAVRAARSLLPIDAFVGRRDG